MSDIESTAWEQAPALDSWRPPRLVPGEKARAGGGKSIGDVRTELQQRIEAHLSGSKPGLLICRGAPGVGKTYTARSVAERVAAAKGTYVSWFGTRHDQFENFRDSEDWIDVGGRQRGEPYANHQRAGPKCHKAFLAKVIGAKGYSVCKLLCHHCRSVGVCPWWQQWNVERHRFMPSEYLAASKLWGRSGSPVILDELNAKQLLPDPVVFDYDAMEKWLHTWPKLEPVFWRLVDFISSESGDYLADHELYERLSRKVPRIPRTVLRQLQPPLRGDEDLARHADSLPHRRAAELLRALDHEKSRHLHGERFISRVAVHQGRLIYYPEPEIPDELYNHSVVLLNATVGTQVLRRALGGQNPDYQVRVYEPQVALHPETEIHFVIEANHSKTAVRRSDFSYNRRWRERLRNGIAGSRRALVIATKEGESVLRPYLSDLIDDDQVILDHYGAVSGLNDYEDCDTVVLAQPFNPRPSAVAGLYRSLHGGDLGEPLRTETCFRLRTFNWTNGEGETYQVAVSSMRDDRLAPIYEHWRWAEMYQAAHRVRPVLHKRRIVVTCAIPMAGLEPTTVAYTRGKAGTRAKLVAAAERLLECRGSYRRGTLAEEADLHFSTAARHWSAVLESLNLRVKEMPIPSERYPGGRPTEVAMPK